MELKSVSLRQWLQRRCPRLMLLLPWCQVSAPRLCDLFKRGMLGVVVCGGRRLLLREGWVCELSARVERYEISRRLKVEGGARCLGYRCERCTDACALFVRLLPMGGRCLSCAGLCCATLMEVERV